ncbi:hypothetical protein [Halochromatium glycolicum]|nr:hypothetical protein [Halochromatium glycolicum]
MFTVLIAMLEFLFALLFFSLAFAGLAAGVLAGRGAVTGSCGGLNQIPGLSSDCGGACRSGRVCPNRSQGPAAQTPEPD